jgi:hypothetical protein
MSTPILPQPSILGWMEESERGTNARIKYFTNVIGAPDTEKPQVWQREIDDFNREARTAQAKAVGRLTLNASLAIRNALDRAQDHRHGKRS